MKITQSKPKPMPSLKSDAGAERFVATADLSQYDLSGFKPMRFEFELKSAAPAAPAASVPTHL